MSLMTTESWTILPRMYFEPNHPCDMLGMFNWISCLMSGFRGLSGQIPEVQRVGKMALYER